MEIIPKGAVVDSYAFYDGKLEFNIASLDIFVNAYTISKPVYMFWQCLRHDPRRLHEMVTSDSFKFGDNDVFAILQDMWYTHTSPFITASMFFILNRCSANGLISSGDLKLENYTPLALAHLKGFKFPDNFHLNLSEKDPLEIIQEEGGADYNLIPAGRFTYNLFEYGKNIAIEETPINHRRLSEIMQKAPSKIIVVYDYNPAIFTVFKESNITMVDQYGKLTDNKSNAEEMIVANF